MFEVSGGNLDLMVSILGTLCADDAARHALLLRIVVACLICLASTAETLHAKLSLYKVRLREIGQFLLRRYRNLG